MRVLGHAHVNVEDLQTPLHVWQGDLYVHLITGRGRDRAKARDN